MTSMEDGLEAQLADLEARYRELSSRAAMANDVNVVWVIVSAVLVFFMQVGFAMLEVGSVSPKNTKAVLLKNIGDASFGALCWWLVGFALAYGTDMRGLVGTDMFALNGGADRGPGMKEAEWTFNWAFAATSVTIVSGAIAERVKIAAYMVYSIVLTSFIYPLVVHWVWHPSGWASAYREDGDLLVGCGAVDFAGSGVVHMVGGTAALVAARAVKARKGRFRSDGSVCRMPQQSPALHTLGTLILWVGWYAFNAGSAITITGGRSVVAARAAVSTTIGPSAAVLVMVVVSKIMEKKFDTRGVNNGILAGLVSITAGAPLINAEGAFVIGVVSAGVYYCSANLLLKLRIDDVVDAVPVHLFGGMWGLVAAGLFTTREGWALSNGEELADECCGLFYGCGWNLLLANLALLGTILTWVGVTATILFWGIDRTVGLRVPPNEEEVGMDSTRHGFATGDGNNGGGGSKHWSHSVSGSDAVRRAVTKAQWSFGDETLNGGAHSRSQQSSRAGSLTTSKHVDVTAPAAGMFPGGSGGKSGEFQSWRATDVASSMHDLDPRGPLAAGPLGRGGVAGRSSRHLFPQSIVSGVGSGDGAGGGSAFPQERVGGGGGLQLGPSAGPGGDHSALMSDAVATSSGRNAPLLYGIGEPAIAGAPNPMHDNIGVGRSDSSIDDHEAAAGRKSRYWPNISKNSERKSYTGAQHVFAPGVRWEGRATDWRRDDEKMPDPTEVCAGNYADTTL